MDALNDLRPTWRGLLHRFASPVFAVAFLVLIARTPPDDGDRLAVVVYALGVVTMLSVSALYHAASATPSRRSRVLQRFDHAGILMAIAGTYTAVTALAVEPPRRGQLLFGIWLAAAVGVVVQVLIVNAPRWVGAIGYVVVGWFAVFDIPAYVRGTTGAELAWVAAGGFFYTVGAVVYGRKAPNPIPGVFGYHEVFHAFTLAGAGSHFVAVALLVSRA